MTLTAMEFPSMRSYSVRLRGNARRRFLNDGSKRAAVRFRGTIPVELQVRGRTAPFITADYSEIGLAVRAQDPRNAPTLGLGDEVSGFIGPAALFRIPFEGHVVRTWEEGGLRMSGLTVQLSTTDD